jgi:dipeptidyl aminopeptidase/acylaminoacyl peptidase
MGPYTYFYYIGRQVTVDNEFSSGMKPLKAGKTNAWIVRRENASQAPNYWFTKDFIHYKQLTNLQPQKSYNWLSSELVSFKQLDGTMSQGTLYKPENFDSTKKYPVLFNYYQQFAARLYQYPEPGFTGGNINIPWFVNRGYLVFTPDIYYTVGKPGEGEYNTLMSAARYLVTLRYVDGARMGINGHSTGGFETNYLVSHTNIFAAALAGAGGADELSCALQLSGMRGTDRGSRLGSHEPKHQSLPWRDSQNWLDYSPIMHVDKVTTPLLLMHNMNDGAVPWEQSVEFFIALRRENKKVWMLQYDGGGHTVWGRDAIDYTKRITQFFNHYLKGYSPPRWMTEGRLASLKGIDDRFELDYEGSCGPDCKICQHIDYSNGKREKF